MDNRELHKHLAVLELELDASWEEIKASYRELAQIWHPDRFNGKSNLQKRAHLKLQKINESYEILKNYCQDSEYQKSMDDLQDARRKTEDEKSVSDFNVSGQVIKILRQVPGMTKAHSRDFNSASPRFRLRDGSVLKIWKNPVGVDHVFIADRTGKMMFGGFVGWIHADGFYQVIDQIQKDFT